MDAVNDISLFRWRLAETIAWCNAPRDPTSINRLRSAILQPAAFDASPPYSAYTWETPSDHAAAVAALSEARAQSLHREQRYPSARAENLAGGRLLLYEPDRNLFDGAAEAESDGFFDIDNAPPWDTWVWHTIDDGVSYLVAWVPTDALVEADAGIWVNPEQCIMWATDVDMPLTRQLNRVKLLG